MWEKDMRAPNIHTSVTTHTALCTWYCSFLKIFFIFCAPLKQTNAPLWLLKVHPEDPKCKVCGNAASWRMMEAMKWEMAFRIIGVMVCQSQLLSSICVLTLPLELLSWWISGLLCSGEELTIGREIWKITSSSYVSPEYLNWRSNVDSSLSITWCNFM